MDVPCWHLTSLPYVLVALVVRWLPCPSDVASLDCTAHLFHIGDPISAIEEGLRLRAKVACRLVGTVLPPGEISWTQWLLWVERRLIANTNRKSVVACSSIHSAFVDVEGHLLTCGASTSVGPGSNGLLGQGIDVVVSTVPRRVSGLDGVHIRSVALGASHTLALCNLGIVYTFGRGDYGQLGYHIDTEVQLIPRPIHSLVDVQISAVAGGHVHSLAVGITGVLYTFGSGRFGQLGLGTGWFDLNPVHQPRIVSALYGVRVTAVSAGGYHSLVLSKESEVYTFGKSESGQLGHGDPWLLPEDPILFDDHWAAQFCPKRIESLVGVEICGVAAGDDHSLTVSSTGSLYTFGKGWWGQLGHGYNYSDQFSPMLVTALHGVRILAAAGGYDHSVVIGEHSVYSFGLNECGELGHGDVEPQESPTIIERLHGMHIHSVSAGHNASIATTVNGEAYGWGVGVEYVAHGLPPIPHQLLGLELHADQLVPLLYPNLQMCMHGL